MRIPWEKLKVPTSLLATYVSVYFLWGVGMNEFGKFAEIAQFTYWWQIITCYVLYMIPISLMLRGLKWYDQYAYGLIFMCALEFGGYALETSYAYPNNILDQFFGERNFSLSMAMFFGLYFPIGNWGVGKIHQLIFLRKS